MPDRKTWIDISLMLSFAALIAVIYPLIKIAENGIPPLTVALLRALFAAILLLIVTGPILKRDLSVLKSRWPAFAILGALLTGFFISVTIAEQRISASLGALMSFTLPVITFLLTTLLLRWESFSLVRLTGALIALIGGALFIGFDRLFSASPELIGVVIILIGYGAYAVNMLYARRLDFDPFVATTGTMVFVTLFAGLLAFTFEAPLAIRPDRDAWLAVGFIGVASSGVAYVIFYALIRRAGPVFASTYGYFMPIFAIIFSGVLLGDSFTPQQLAGVGVTLVGAWLVNRKSSENPATRKP